MKEQQVDSSKQGNRVDLTKGGQDILFIVFDLIWQTSPHTLGALALVSQQFHCLATYIRHRSIVLDLSLHKILTSHERLQYARNNQLLPAIRRLEVKDTDESPQNQCFNEDEALITTRAQFQELAAQYQELVALMSDLLPHMSGLKDLIWSSSHYYSDMAPQSIFQALRLCPKIRLHTNIICTPRFSPNPNQFQGSANLYKLYIDFQYLEDRSFTKFTKPLKQLLLSSHGIRSLRLEILREYGPRAAGRSRNKRDYCGLDLVPGESLPSLEELTFLNHPWGMGSTVSSSWTPSESITYSGNGREMDVWAEEFDWSCLRHLNTTEIDFAFRIMPKLISLREINLETHDRRTDVGRNKTIRFYQECTPGLELIGADGFRYVELADILKHGKTLKKLRLHDFENSRWIETAMDIVSLRAIRGSCPLIEELFLDLPRHNDWPWDMLDVLASFPCLTHLTIWFEVGSSVGIDFRKPYVTFKTVDTIYKHLLSHASPRQQCKVSRFHVYSGAPQPPPNVRTSLLRLNCTEFVCTLSERDDEAARGIFEIVCPKILRWDRRPEDSMTLAHEGPWRQSQGNVGSRFSLSVRPRS